MSRTHPPTPAVPDHDEPPTWRLIVIIIAGIAVIVGGSLMLIIDRNWVGAVVVLLGCQMVLRPTETHIWLDRLISKLPGGPDG